MPPTLPSNYERIYQVVRQIPEGYVATYGDVARWAGLPRHARLVGYALHACGQEDLPWQRVVNAKGELSLKQLDSDSAHLQRCLLEAEGIEFEINGHIKLSRYRWNPALAAFTSY